MPFNVLKPEVGDLEVPEGRQIFPTAMLGGTPLGMNVPSNVNYTTLPDDRFVYIKGFVHARCRVALGIESLDQEIPLVNNFSAELLDFFDDRSILNSKEAFKVLEFARFCFLFEMNINSYFDNKYFDKAWETDNTGQKVIKDFQRFIKAIVFNICRRFNYEFGDLKITGPFLIHEEMEYNVQMQIFTDALEDKIDNLHLDPKMVIAMLKHFLL